MYLGVYNKLPKGMLKRPTLVKDMNNTLQGILKRKALVKLINEHQTDSLKKTAVGELMSKLKIYQTKNYGITTLYHQMVPLLYSNGTFRCTVVLLPTPQEDTRSDTSQNPRHIAALKDTLKKRSNVMHD